MQTFLSPLNTGEVIEGSDHESKVNLIPDTQVFLMIDYVLFDDGTSWGNNSRKASEYISGIHEGQSKAISIIKDFILKSNEASLSQLLQQNVIEIDSSFIDKSKPVKWQNGFSMGYKIVFLELKELYKKNGMEFLPTNTETFNLLMKPVTYGM